MTDLTLVELFAGIGGFSCGFQRAGVRTVAAVEIDAQCRLVLSQRFPEAALFDDVTEVSGDDFRAVGFVPSRGILTAGWPCQDLSVAGNRQGINASRSGLFWHVVRLLADLQPRWFVLENVPNLLSINRGRDMGAVIGALAEFGIPFSYRVLDASRFGVPQRRRRVFFVGHFGESWDAPVEVLLEPESVYGDFTQGDEAEPQDTGASVSGADECCERGSGRRSVAALTANGVGTCGADDNQAQAGHLIADFRDAASPLCEEYEQHS